MAQHRGHREVEGLPRLPPAAPPTLVLTMSPCCPQLPPRAWVPHQPPRLTPVNMQNSTPGGKMPVHSPVGCARPGRCLPHTAMGSEVGGADPGRARAVLVRDGATPGT